MKRDETLLLCSLPQRENVGGATCGSLKGRNSLLVVQLGSSVSIATTIQYGHST